MFSQGVSARRLRPVASAPGAPNAPPSPIRRARLEPGAPRNPGGFSETKHAAGCCGYRASHSAPSPVERALYVWPKAESPALARLQPRALLAANEITQAIDGRHRKCELKFADHCPTAGLRRKPLPLFGFWATRDHRVAQKPLITNPKGQGGGVISNSHLRHYCIMAPRPLSLRGIGSILHSRCAPDQHDLVIFPSSAPQHHCPIPEVGCCNIHQTRSSQPWDLPVTTCVPANTDPQVASPHNGVRRADLR